MNLVQLQWKETFRAPQWEAKLSIKIIIVLFMLYLIGAFAFGASMVYPILNKKILDREPLEVFNGILLYIFFFELIIRFFFTTIAGNQYSILDFAPFQKETNH